MKTSLLASIVLISSVSAAFAEDCVNLSGDYRLIHGTEKFEGCPDFPRNEQNCFRFPSTRFELQMSGCENGTLHIPGILIGADQALNASDNGKTLHGKSRILLRDVVTVIRQSQQDPSVVELEQSMKNALPNNLGYQRSYRAQFRRR